MVGLEYCPKDISKIGHNSSHARFHYKIVKADFMFSLYTGTLISVGRKEKLVPNVWSVSKTPKFYEFVMIKRMY